MIHIDLEKATQLLEQCVKERGEGYVYPNDQCRYVDGASEMIWIDETQQYVTIETPHEAKPGCMVGLALIKAGVPMSAFLELGINNTDSGGALAGLEKAGYLTTTESADDLFGFAQEHQDHGKPWGIAFETARKEVSLDSQQV